MQSALWSGLARANQDIRLSIENGPAKRTRHNDRAPLITIQHSLIGHHPARARASSPRGLLLFADADAMLINDVHQLILDHSGTLNPHCVRPRERYRPLWSNGQDNRNSRRDENKPNCQHCHCCHYLSHKFDHSLASAPSMACIVF